MRVATQMVAADKHALRAASDAVKEGTNAEAAHKLCKQAVAEL